MKYLVGIIRIFVGILFIISGFIKLNDPVGFSFKLEEYFSPSVLDLGIFLPYALAIAIIVVTLEVLLGAFLIIGYKVKLTLWSLLGMILFFTFLTFYSAYFNKVTDCGCFGDALKLTPWQSFTKDVVLLVLILFLFFNQKWIKPFFTSKGSQTVLIIALLSCIGFVYQVINHLPTIDFRPYKIGKNISLGMAVPVNAPKAIYEYSWKFKVNGEEKVYTTKGAYPKVKGEFLSVKTVEIQEGYSPPIHDFTIEQEGEDFTSQFLATPKLVLVIAYDLRKSNLAMFKEVKLVTDQALAKGYRVIGMSASGKNQTTELKMDYQLNFDFYFTDETTLKTIVRSNPGVLVLEKGTITQKVHYNDLQNLTFK